MTRKTFVSIGECMAELQAANDSHYRLGFAGDTLNTAWYVKALTGPGKVDVEYLTAVGTDQLSQNMTAFLKANKIGLRFIREVPDRTVGLYLITLNGTERAFTYWRSESAARLLADDETFLRAALSQADVIYFSGITLAILAPRQRKSLLSVLREMKSRGGFGRPARRSRKHWSRATRLQPLPCQPLMMTVLCLATEVLANAPDALPPMALPKSW
jgi:2-dehydro-3-deoxygluconokinase